MVELTLRVAATTGRKAASKDLDMSATAQRLLIDANISIQCRRLIVAMGSFTTAGNVEDVNGADILVDNEESLTIPERDNVDPEKDPLRPPRPLSLIWSTPGKGKVKVPFGFGNGALVMFAVSESLDGVGRGALIAPRKRCWSFRHGRSVPGHTGSRL